MLFLLEVPKISMKKSDEKVKEIDDSLDDDAASKHTNSNTSRRVPKVILI